MHCRTAYVTQRFRIFAAHNTRKINFGYRNPKGYLPFAQSRWTRNAHKARSLIFLTSVIFYNLDTLYTRRM